MLEGLKKIFNKKDVQYIQQTGYDKPYWTTQKDEQFVKEGYNKLVWVYSCVSMISSCVSSVPWVLYRKSNKNMLEIEEHPILTLVNSKANNFMSSKDFFDLWATYLALQGKFFAEYNNPALPTQLFPIYPHYMQPIPSKTNFIQGFKYTIDTQGQYYPSENILWVKFNDPLSVYDGLSPIRALSRTIDTENEAVNWNKATLQNSAVPAGALSVVNPSPELQEKLRGEWIKRYTGAQNARVPLILNAEKASYIPFGMNHTDMDFLEQRKLNRIEICSAFGVPSQVVGDPEGQTYANYEEALKAFWQNTIIPRYLETIKDSLNMNICSKYADNLYLDYNLDNVTALQESVNAMADRVTNLFKSNLISRNEARESIGYEKTDNKEIFFNDLMMIETTEEEVKKKDITQTKLLNFKNDIQLDEYKAEWKAIDENRLKYEKKVEKLFKENFETERKNIQKQIADSNTVDGIEETLDMTSKTKINILRATYITMLDDYGTQTYNKLSTQKQEKEFNANDENLKDFIDTITAEKVVMIDETTMKEIKKIIEESIDTLSIEEIADKINLLYLDQIIPNRSTLIARTETVSASNFGSISGAFQAEADFNVQVKKKWLPTFDGKTRDTHMALLDTPAINLDEKFNVGGSQMLYPADMNGSASEVCNCRCAITYVRK